MALQPGRSPSLPERLRLMLSSWPSTKQRPFCSPRFRTAVGIRFPTVGSVPDAATHLSPWVCPGTWQVHVGFLRFRGRAFGENVKTEAAEAACPMAHAHTEQGPCVNCVVFIVHSLPSRSTPNPCTHGWEPLLLCPLPSRQALLAVGACSVPRRLSLGAIWTRCPSLRPGAARGRQLQQWSLLTASLQSRLGLEDKVSV